MNDTPVIDPRQYDTIPDELKQYNQFVLWSYCDVGDGNKPRKIPINPTNGVYVNSHEKQYQYSYNDAIAFKEQGVGTGIGFVFTKDDPFVFIDLDKCINNMQFNPVTNQILSAVSSWSEFSISGEGIHIIAEIDTVEKNIRGGGIEIYYQDQFCALTGKTITNTPASIQKCSEGVKWVNGVVRTMMPTKREHHSSDPNKEYETTPLSDIQKALDSISPDRDYHEWLNVLMAVHRETGGSAEGLAMVDTWSSTGTTYNPGEVIRKWQGFDGAGGVGMGTVFHYYEQETGKQFYRVRAKDIFQRVGVTPLGHATAHPGQDNIIDARTLISSQEHIAKFIINKFMPESSLGVMYGESSALKSYLLLHMAVSVASGMDFAGNQILAPKPVFILLGEGSESMNQRFLALMNHLNIDPSSITQPIIFRNATLMDLTEDINQIESEIQQQGSGLLLVDTFASLNKSVEENFTGEVQQLINAYGALSRRNNLTTLLVHHANEQGDIRGSKTLRKSVDFLYKMERIKNDDGEPTPLTSLKIEKQKNYSTPLDPYIFKAHKVTLPGMINQDGSEVTNLAVEYHKEGIPGKSNNAGGKKYRMKKLQHKTAMIYSRLLSLFRWSTQTGYSTDDTLSHNDLLHLYGKVMTDGLHQTWDAKKKSKLSTAILGITNHDGEYLEISDVDTNGINRYRTGAHATQYQADDTFIVPTFETEIRSDHYDDAYYEGEVDETPECLQ